MGNTPAIIRVRKNVAAVTEEKVISVAEERSALCLDEHRELARLCLEDLIKKIVRLEKDVMVHFTTGPQTTVFEVVVNPSDMKYLIGKKGATIEALRVVCKTIIAKHGLRAVLQIDEELEARCAKKSILSFVD